MAGVFKAGRGYHYPVQPTTDTVVIDNSIKIKPVAPPDIADETQEITETAESTEKVDEAALQRNRLIDEEIEKVKQHYRAEGEKALADARERAQKILSDTEKQTQDYAAKAKEQAEAILRRARQTALQRVTRTAMLQDLINAAICLQSLKSSANRW